MILKLFKALLLITLLIPSLYAQHRAITLDEAIATALKNNDKLKISKTEIEIANVQYRQAMSANYPTLSLEASATRRDEPATFNFNGSVVLPQSLSTTLALSGAMANNALNGIPNNAATLGPVAAAAPSQTLPMNMEVGVLGRDTLGGQLNMLYPLYTGGKITSLIKQAKLGELISRENEARARSEVIFDIKKYYYGAMLLRNIKQLLSDTYDRLSFVRDLSEELYKGGSTRVKKTGYLRSKLTVGLIEAMREDAVYREKLALSALGNAMGSSWSDTIEVSQNSFVEPELEEKMRELIGAALKFNPQISVLRLAVDVEDARVNEAKSAYFPHFAIKGNIQRISNDYNNYGLGNDRNKRSWTIGVGLQWNLFDGMLTKNRVAQSRLEKRKLTQQQVMLEEGLALQIKHALLQINSSYNKHNILSKTLKVASENRDLNTRAYREDLVETKDVIESQIFESLTKSNYYRSLHDHAVARATSEFIVGVAIERAIGE